MFQAAELRYQEGRYADAIELLNEAWQIHQAPPILYNLGRAHEELGAREAAIDAYRRYLSAEPRSPVRPELEERISALERAIAREGRDREREAAEGEAAERAAAEGGGRGGATAEVEPTGETTETIETATETETIAIDGDVAAPSIWPKVLLGAGIAALATGVAFGLMSDGAEETARTGRVHLEARDAYRTAQTYSTIANVAFVAGGVLAATGLVWLLLDDPGDEPSVSVAIGPSSLAVRGSFR